MTNIPVMFHDTTSYAFRAMQYTKFLNGPTNGLIDKGKFKCPLYSEDFKMFEIQGLL